tara:strand:- start:355 stop:948 length:594 start_codon:yes stop_codon:yes gene_type:complete
MSLCEVYDDKLDAKYLHELFEIVQVDLKYRACNIANPTTWPYGMTGSHKLFGSRIFFRQNFNRIDYLDNKNSQKFFDLFDFLCNLTNRTLYLDRIDVNLQHTGCNGTLHQDSAPWDEQHRTMMVFPNPVWEKEWGGQFQLFDKEGNELLEEYDYVPGRIIIFPSHLAHRGLGPLQEYVYRYSIVFGVRQADPTLTNF